MSNSEITSEINKLGKEDVDYSNLLEKIISYKESFAKEGKETEAKQFWIFEQIVEIHRDYNQAFSLLLDKKYYDGWCKLENIEISFHFLKKHFAFDKSQFKLYFIEKAIRNMQAIFPYRIFSSIEMLEKEKKCNICDKIVTVRNPCGHKSGEIYGGKLCLRIITDFDLLGVALVENPVNKYTVAFTSDPKTKETVDQYNYDTVDYLMDLIRIPYEPWDLQVHNKYLPHSDFSYLGKDDFCPCNSGKKYGDCCLPNTGVKCLHFKFLVKEEIAKKFISKQL